METTYKTISVNINLSPDELIQLINDLKVESELRKILVLQFRNYGNSLIFESDLEDENDN